MPNLNYLAIIASTLVQFVLGALWFSALFGKAWANINGFDMTDKKKMEEMQKQMTPFYLLQLAMTFLMNFAIAILIPNTTGLHWTAFSGLLWAGIIVPVVVANVIWGNTKREKWSMQLFILLSNHLLNMLIAGFIISAWK